MNSKGVSYVSFQLVIGNRLSNDGSDPGMKSQIFVPTFEESDGRLQVYSNINFYDAVNCRYYAGKIVYLYG